MLYEYQCKECEFVFERVLRMSEASLPKTEPCPDCGHTGSVERYFSSVPGLSYSSVGAPVGDQKFQKEVLAPIFNKVPKRLRAETKFKTTSDF